MATIPTARTKPQTKSATGLLASGSCGRWEIDIDEALSGPDRWWMQIEGPSASLSFEVSSLDVIGKMARLLAPRSAATRRRTNGSAKRAAEFELRGTGSLPVKLLKDDEFDDRFFFVVSQRDNLTVRLVLAGTDASDIVEALRQIKEELRDA